jgi:multidrug efflux pump subunit AcrA (membrane-fusion protein)
LSKEPFLSPLTKLFVGLLVVLSLLLTASTVTFVSTLDNQRQKAQQAQQQVEAEKARADALLTQAQSDASQAQEAQRLAQAQVEQLKQQSNADQALLKDHDLKVAQLTADRAIQAADITRMAEALKASEDTKSKMNDMVVALRGANDQALQQAAQSSQQISDLTNKLEVTERERRYATEQLEELRGQNAKLSNAIQEMGRNPREILASISPGAVASVAPKINGVVRDVRTIANLPYATISVGSADGVVKGMVFNIVERNGTFLGKLTIDTVELNESTGRMTGPKIDQVAKGAEVKTQL